MLTLTAVLAVPTFAKPPALLALGEVTTDPCGVLHGAVLARESLLPRKVLLSIGGEEETVTVPAGERRVAFTRYVGRDSTTELQARWWFVDTQALSPPPDSTHAPLRLQAPSEHPLGEDESLVVTIDERCDLSMLSLSVDSDLPPLSLWAQPPVAHLTEVPIELSLGRHTLTARLSSGESLVDEQKVSVTVAPPCEDNDGDGYLSCRNGDCDDHDNAVHPGAHEIEYNGRDENCDGRDGRDMDRDGFVAVIEGGDDCDDSESAVHPGAKGFPDKDHDGFASATNIDYDCDGDIDILQGQLDCNDRNSKIPRAEESRPNGVDEDCDGLIDEGTVAFDDDGDGLAERQGDCDDSDMGVYPGAPERPNCRDDDCDSLTDEGVLRLHRDDSYEPNDEVSVSLGGATHVPGLFGGYRGSQTRVGTITRDESDIERFKVFAHDGTLDSFFVSVSILEIGDTLGYRVIVQGPGGRTTRVVRKRGDTITVGGAAGHTDTGNYSIEITPLSGFEDLRYCPLVFDVSTG